MANHELASLFTSYGAKVPEEYIDVAAAPERLPPYFRDELFTEPGRIRELNEELRASGFFDQVWPGSFVAIGEDPGGNVYFLDSCEPNGPVRLADHERAGEVGTLEEYCGTEILAGSFGAWLEVLREQNEEMEEERPSSVHLRGHKEFERLRNKPSLENLEKLFLARSVPFCALSKRQQYRAGQYLFDYMFRNLPTDVCFELLPAALNILLAQRNRCMFRVALYLLADIAQGSRTTERPFSLTDAWDEIGARIAQYRLQRSEEWERLRRHYRLG